MSSLMQRVKEVVSPEERMKKQAKKALDIADRIIVEMQAQQINIKKCCTYQETMLNNLHKVMDSALKLGNKPLYMHSGKLAEVVGNWHAITKQMMTDESVMIQFVGMIKTFYQALIEYKQIVKDFGDTTKVFSELQDIGQSIPKQIETLSGEAATAFRALVNSLASIPMSYTRVTDYVTAEDEDKWSNRFDEERQRLLETPGNKD